ncbi:hypothetical protein Tco_0418976 [Tanacetum coccineum]
MWPVILKTYNLPSWLCMKESSFMLTLLIPGPKSPGKDIDVYLRHLIDDLKVLWALKGVETIDVATCHKRSLEFNGEIEDKDPPRKFDRDQIQVQLARLPTRVNGKHPSYGGVKIKRNVLVKLNWTKRSIFYELEYWSFLTLKHNLDIMHIEKNVLEAILNTLLMNDKSKDTAKARQDLKRLGIRSGLWLGQTKNEKCSKPQAAYSFTPENRKKFCQFIKGVKLPDGFGSNFKHKVTDNDTNITGLKSHDCHIMMQRLLPYGLQQYLPDEDDMLKAQSKVVDIMCNIELIYPPAFFDIMIHLVIHLPLEALEGGPIRPRWMFPFERFMKKLKGYVRNKAKPEGSIAEGYVAEEALTFSSHYFRDVTTKFNRPDRNVDPPPPTCQFQVFRSLCKSIGLRSVIRFDAQELKKVIWYVLHNSPEIDTYRSQFKSKFPNKDMKEEFPNWFGSQIRQRHVDNDPGVSATSELFALACGPTPTPISVNSCVVNGMSTDVARGHGGDGGGDDRPPSHHIPTGCGGCFANRGKGTRKANLGGRKAGRLHTRQETRNLGLKKITDDKGPVPIRFEWDDKKTMMPLGGHASHWSNYLGELIREMPLYYPSWQKVPAERKAAIVTKIGASLNAAHWVINPETGTYDVETIRHGRPESITPADWDAQIAFWNDPRNQARAAQNRQNRAKSTVVCRQGSRSLARLRDEMASTTSRLCPTLRSEKNEEINAMARKGKQRGHLPGVGRVLPGRARDVLIPPPPPPPQCTHNSGDVQKLKKKNKYLTKQVNLMMKLFRSDDKFSQMLRQYESTPEFGSGSGGCGDDEIADDEDGGEDEEDEEDEEDGDS